MIDKVEEIRKKLREKARPEKIEFYKMSSATPWGVIGVSVPDSREIARDYKNLNIYEVYNLFEELYDTEVHEEKIIAIHILQQYHKQFSVETWKFLKERISNFNTWDQVDYLATDVMAKILVNNFQLMAEVKEMANSRNFWERRIAIESTAKLIRKGKIELTLLLAEKLVYDENKYVQKGVGWMLREAGKKDRLSVREFILRHLNMKPTAFSYATEKMKELRDVRKEKLREKKNDKSEKT